MRAHNQQRHGQNASVPFEYFEYTILLKRYKA